MHHGQGTQQLFYDDPRVLHFSIHRYEYGEFWPNLPESDYDSIGAGEGKGFNFNVPLNKTGMNNADYMAIWQQILIPVAAEVDMKRKKKKKSINLFLFNCDNVVLWSFF